MSSSDSPTPLFPAKPIPPFPVKYAPIKLEHFLYSQTANCRECVIAQAANDALAYGYCATMTVEGLKILGRNNNLLQKILPPQVAIDLMKEFDAIELIALKRENWDDLYAVMAQGWELEEAITIFQRVQLFMKYWKLKVQLPAEFCGE